MVRPIANGTAIQDAYAIALQLPPGGAVSGVTALDLWRPHTDGWGDLPRLAIAPHSTRPHIQGVRVLRPTEVLPDSVAWHRGIPLRTLGDALMDLFTVLSATRAKSLLDRALQLHWIDADTLHDLAPSRLGKGRTGSRTIRQLMSHASEGSHSEAERRTAALLRKSDLRGWIANYKHRAPTGRVIAELDFAWPRARVCLEIDGWAYHSDRRAFELDRARQNALAADGWTVLRATWTQVTCEPRSLIANLRATIARAARENPLLGKKRGDALAVSSRELVQRRATP